MLFDRDGTLITNVPYLADPDGVRPVVGARRTLRSLRRRGVPVGVVSNQSGVARGLISLDALARVNARVDHLLGPFDTWQVCPHGADDACGCRKPAPGMVEAAARELGVRPSQCVLIGDIGADVDAALAAGARAVLVPNAATRLAEIDRASVLATVAPTLGDAVRLSFGGLAVTAPEHARRGRVLIARLDSLGDVLLTGGAVRVGGRQRRPRSPCWSARGRPRPRACCRASMRCWSSRRRGWCWILRRCRRPR